MNESLVKTKLVKDLRAAGHYARRFEDQFAVGVPDMHVILAGQIPSWVEVKLIRGASFCTTPRQKVELDRIHKASPGRVAAVMAGYKGGNWHMAWPSADPISIKECWSDQSFANLLQRWISCLMIARSPETFSTSPSKPSPRIDTTNTETPKTPSK